MNSTYDVEYQRLVDYSAVFHRYGRYVATCIIVGFVFLSIGLFLTGPSTITDPLMMLIITSNPILGLILFGRLTVSSAIVLAIALLSFLTAAIFERKRSGFNLASEEWLLLDVQAILESLDSCLGEKNLSRKVYYRNKATDTLKRAVERVSYWRTDRAIGKLRIVKNLVGDEIARFRASMENKLLPAVEEGTEEDLKRSRNILNDLRLFLRLTEPPVESLKHINEEMSKLSITRTTKPSPIERIKRSLDRSTVFLLVLLMCAPIGGISTFYFGVLVIGISEGDAYSAAMAAVIGLIVAAIDVFLKRRK